MAEVLSRPAAEWSSDLECSKCHTLARYDVADIQYDSFKMSGYDFNDTADWQAHYFVQCPTCNHCLLIDRAEITEVIKLYVIEHENYHKVKPR